MYWLICFLELEYNVGGKKGAEDRGVVELNIQKHHSELLQSTVPLILTLYPRT